MKIYLLAASCLLLTCCHPKSTQQTAAVIDSTNIAGDNDIQPNFKVDTISYQDTMYHLAVDITYAYPKDDATGIYKTLVTNRIDSSLKEFKNEISKVWKEEGEDEDKTDFDGLSHNMFDAGPAFCYSDDKVISTSFTIGYSHAGAAHAFNGVYSINFDKRTQQVITLKDYFQFKTKADSNLIIHALDGEFGELRQTLKNDNPWEFYGMEHLCFGILKDSVVFSFSDYQLGQGPSMENCKVSKQLLISLIRESYK
ncbi:hypothetical protein CLV59_109307 [Chitinophaga dinghuensis]|uniref:Deacetylase PdaC domain-containing protein n=1 Tax=Chitinophaga dinghuensis TaxID=1539050 RepID=A0A327VPC8_9BACT|nr:hypothetical protein [Chitinophaga dinghuensis]RAJ75693.1 hypothetical protein CLV59_109307 [Chitinophaga dinghuensis]